MKGTSAVDGDLCENGIISESDIDIKKM